MINILELVNRITLDNETLNLLGASKYVREFRTFNIEVPRRVGKTYIIERLAVNAMQGGKYPIILVPGNMRVSYSPFLRPFLIAEERANPNTFRGIGNYIVLQDDTQIFYEHIPCPHIISNGFYNLRLATPRGSSYG